MLYSERRAKRNYLDVEPSYFVVEAPHQTLRSKQTIVEVNREITIVVRTMFELSKF